MVLRWTRHSSASSAMERSRIVLSSTDTWRAWEGIARGNQLRKQCGQRVVNSAAHRSSAPPRTRASCGSSGSTSATPLRTERNGSPSEGTPSAPRALTERGRGGGGGGSASNSGGATSGDGAARQVMGAEPRQCRAPRETRALPPGGDTWTRAKRSRRGPRPPAGRSQSALAAALAKGSPCGRGRKNAASAIGRVRGLPSHVPEQSRCKALAGAVV